jgi:type I restriction enzyme S subunit
MKLPQYAKYKDSGTNWLGSVPAHWEVRRLGFFFDERRQKVSDADFAPLSVTKGGVVPQLETAAKSDDGENRKLVRAGDFVINSRSDRKGSSGAARQDGSVSLICTVLRPTTHVSIKFAHHLLRSLPFQEEFYRHGKGIVADLWSTNYSEMRNILLAMPSHSEQTAIAAFLDLETAKIDALVAEQEKLLALLAEKRRAAISHAVTRGLNPDAPMKKSGVPWLGEVPAHWDVYPLKRELASLTSGSRGWAEHYADAGALFVRIANLTRDGLDLNLADVQHVAVPEGTEGERTRVLPGDLLFSITAYLGSVAVAPQAIGLAYVSQHVALARLRGDHVLSDWVGYVTLSVIGQTYLEMQAYGGTKIQLSLEDVANLPITVPPVAEQARILSSLAAELAQVRSLRSEAMRVVELLKERRSALITAVVTGRVDVRRMTLPEKEQALAA